MAYRIAFFFHQDVTLSLDDLNDLLSDIGERTFELWDEETWHHKKYKSTVMWKHDIDSNIFTTNITGGESARTCGSLVEWMLRNGPEYLNDVDRDLKVISVFT